MSLKSLKVQELRDRLSELGLDTTGLKQVLIDRLQAALEEKEKNSGAQSAQEKTNENVLEKREEKIIEKTNENAKELKQEKLEEKPEEKLEEKKSENIKMEVKKEVHVPSSVKVEATMEEDSIKSENPMDNTDEEVNLYAVQPRRNEKSSTCPYLDTVDRKVLDFDFEKLCSVCLSNQNVYGCLVCGKYFQGRGKKSYAYTHAVQTEHHIFIHLETGLIYCLPEGYEIIDSSLDDIKYNLHPTYSASDISNIDSMTSRTLSSTFVTGFVGMNDISKNDWLNSTIQSLVHIPLLRNYFLDSKNSQVGDILAQRFGEFVRKVWNIRNFKDQVSPHELLQAIATASDKKYRPGQQSDPLMFLSWFLNKLHIGLGGTKKRDSSIIFKTFQGELLIKIEKVALVDVEETPMDIDTKVVNLANTNAPVLMKRKREDETIDSWGEVPEPIEQTPVAPAPKLKEQKLIVEQIKQPFLYLSLNLPDTPLFRDAIDGGSIIPQVPLFELLTKFDGKTPEIQADGSKKYYSISHMPSYLLLHLKRFVVNNFFVEKNPTIVNFPIKNVPFGDYVHIGNPPSIESLKLLPVGELLKQLRARGLSTDDVDKSDMITRLMDSYRPEMLKYDLLASISHTGKLDEGTYKSYVYSKGKDQWFEMENLHVTPTLPQLVAVSEAYLQFYERNT